MSATETILALTEEGPALLEVEPDALAAMRAAEEEQREWYERAIARDDADWILWEP